MDFKNIDSNNPEHRKEFEGLVGLALKHHFENEPVFYEGTPHLSNETLDRMYTGKISKEDRAQAIEHLVNCQGCCNDLQFYIDLMDYHKEKEGSDIK